MNAAALVRDRVGPVEPLVGCGLANTKFRGEGVLVRVNEVTRPEVALGRFRKAAFCGEVSSSCGVPVPYSVEAWVDAEPADRVEDPERWAGLWRQLGALVRKVHRV